MKVKYRVKTHEDFQEVIKAKQTVSNRIYVLYYKKNNLDHSRVGISASKKLGNAVVRNKIRRQIRMMAKEVIDFDFSIDYCIIVRKTYLDNVGGKLPTNFWPFTDAGHTDEAKKEVMAIFDGRAKFDTPKPCRLLEFILRIAGNENTLVLDSFAGSGTTAHAVLNMNKSDGGNRKFILIEMMDYADSTTAERIKRVIDGYGSGKNAVEGTGGSFTFYDLGEALLLPNGNLNENVSVDKIREYVYYMETKESMAGVSNGNPYFMGNSRDAAYYFFYEKDAITTLDHEFLATIPERADSYIIYADLCTIPSEELAKYNITFKKIPRDIAKL